MRLLALALCLCLSGCAISAEFDSKGRITKVSGGVDAAGFKQVINSQRK